MYKQFYGLKRNPFEISPDPFFFYPTPGHLRALKSLHYGVQRRKGFVLLTGEAGTGKTLLVRCLLQLLKDSDIDLAYIFNPRLSAEDFLDYVITDLRMPAGAERKSTTLFRLSDYLVARHNRGTTTALVVDEAHLLNWELMEEIRLLTNLETPGQKLLQIILVGQPELGQRIDSPDLRQLKQRIGLRCHLSPLTGDEIKAYILSRLELAAVNSQPQTVFSDLAILAIEAYSRGIPRLVNTICENALVRAYTRKFPIVPAQIVEEVAHHFGFNQPSLDAASGASRNHQPAAAGSGATYS